MNESPAPNSEQWKAPPIEKVHEALSAVLDDRVSVISDNQADVYSSDRSKHYRVTWNEERTAFGSNDNASFYQGYIGYPIIAVLLTLKTLPFRREQCSVLADVPWKAINAKHKNKYDKAVAALLDDRMPDRDQQAALQAYIDQLFTKLMQLRLRRRAPTSRPPG